MPLPILSSTPTDLVRLYLKTELDWSRQVADETTLDVGTAMTGPRFPGVWHANCLFDAALPDGWTAAQAVAQVDEHFQQAGTRCYEWMMNPSAPTARTQPLIEYLLGLGFRRLSNDILYLSRAPAGPIQHTGNLQIIPARASYRHTRQLMEEDTAGWHTPALLEAKMEHLDDPHVDALTALRDGMAVAHVSVLAVGEIGCISFLYVSEKFRGQGLGRTMMSRALEICARSLFRHVLLSVEPENVAAQSLYAKFGFSKVGEFVRYNSSRKP